MVFRKEDLDSMISSEIKSQTTWSIFISKEGLIFQSSVIILFAITILTLNQNINISEASRGHFLTTMGSISFIVWLALSLSLWRNRLDCFLEYLGWTFLIFGPIGLMIFFSNHKLSEVLFWVNLILWNYVTIKFTISENIELDKWETVLLALSAILGVTSAMVTLGSFHWFPFSQIATERFTSLSYLVDVRFILALILFLCLSGTAIFRALIQESPELKDMPPWNIPVPEAANSIFAVIPPIVQVINVILLVFHAIVELLWKAIQLLVIFFGRVGVEIYNVLRILISQKLVWYDILRSTTVLLLLITGFFSITKASSSWYTYLATSNWREQLEIIPWLLLAIVIIMFCVWAITSLVEKVEIKSVGDATIKSLGWLSIAYLLCSFLVYGYCSLRNDVCGFDKLGIFSAILILFIFSGILYSIKTGKQ